jgi:hypothetical protein
VGRAIHRYCVCGERSTCKFWGGGQNFGTVAVGSSGAGDSGLVTVCTLLTVDLRWLHRFS